MMAERTYFVTNRLCKAQSSLTVVPKCALMRLGTTARVRCVLPMLACLAVVEGDMEAVVTATVVTVVMEEETVMVVAEMTAAVVAVMTVIEIVAMAVMTEIEAAEMTVTVVVAATIERAAVVVGWRNLAAGTGAMTSVRVATDMSQLASSSCRLEHAKVAGTGNLVHAHHPHVANSVLPSLLE